MYLILAILLAIPTYGVSIIIYLFLMSRGEENREELIKEKIGLAYNTGNLEYTQIYWEAAERFAQDRGAEIKRWEDGGESTSLTMSVDGDIVFVSFMRERSNGTVNISVEKKSDSLRELNERIKNVKPVTIPSNDDNQDEHREQSYDEKYEAWEESRKELLESKEKSSSEIQGESQNSEFSKKFKIWKKNREKLDIQAFRNAGVKHGISPIAKMTDNEILTISKEVMTAFRQASEEKGERILGTHLLTIAIKFFVVYETMGTEMYYEHLEYEVEKYKTDGLRADYQKELL